MGAHHLFSTKEYPLGFPCGSAGKESACNVGNPGSIPGLGRSREKGKATDSSILAWRIHYSPWGCKESDTTERLSLSFEEYQQYDCFEVHYNLNLLLAWVFAF